MNIDNEHNKDFEKSRIKDEEARKTEAYHSFEFAAIWYRYHKEEQQE